MLHKFAKNGARVSRKYENGWQNINSGWAMHIVQSSAFEDRASVAGWSLVSKKQLKTAGKCSSPTFKQDRQLNLILGLNIQR